MSLDTASTTEASWSSSSPAAAMASSASSLLSSTVAATTEGSTTSGPITTTTTAAAAVSTTVSNAIVNTVKTLISSTSAPTTTSTMKPSITSPPNEKLNVADISSSLQHFGYVDYFVFIMMLMVCAVIGFYFGFIEKKNKKNKKGDAERRGSEALDYLVGGRKMKVFPVSLSLVASFVSGISLLGTSTEIYVYGTRYAFILITLAVSGVISWYIFLPVFCNLQLTSTYEYLELRYNRRVRLLGSTLFTLSTLFWLPIVIYVPALAFNQVTGVNVHVVTPVVCIVCIFYTTVGGLKAVVWTDVIQTIVMLGAIILVIIKGTVDVGGLGVVWQRNMESGRIEWPAMTLDHTERMSVLSIFVGVTTYYIQVVGGNQVIVQRYLSLPGMKEVKQAHIYFIIGVITLTGITIYNGLLLFATYHDCDPLSTKLATEKDALVPLLVMDLLSVFPGLPGMFVAGVFSAALSSLSTGLNSLVAVFLEDYIKPLRKTPLNEKQTAFTMRLLTVVLGTFCVVCVFIVERMGKHVMELTMTLCSITMGPLLGLFLLGLLVPRINSKYFEMRFGRGIRSLGSVLFLVGMIVWLPVAVYVPAITFNQVTGIGIHVITPIVCIICTFYTCVGGLKAVIWTDVIQSFVMYGSILAVCIKGTYDVGGFDVVWQRNADGGRLNVPEWTLDPTVRLSMASVLIGGTLHKIQSSAVNQISIQRFLSLPTYKDARKAMLLMTILLTFLLLCCAYMGLVSFATYYDCDPIATKLARASDQLPSLLMMRALGAFPGLPGLFVAGVFSAALSSLSTGLNSLACVISQDMINPFLKQKLTERQTAITLRLIVIFFGLSCIWQIFIVEKLGMVLQLSSMTGAVTMGPLLAVYTMGVCLPWINEKSAITGSLVSFVTMAWLCTNAQIGQMNGEIKHAKLPVSVQGCTYEYDNVTAWEIMDNISESEERNIYHLSFLWYATLGFSICVITAGLSSFIYGCSNLDEMDPALITPCMRRFLPKQKNYQAVDLEELFRQKTLAESETATVFEKLAEDEEKKEKC